MIKQLYIKNFTIITQLHLDFSVGLTVLTGETGAGKSIILDALQLALGERADINLIHPDYDRCEISVVFDLASIPNALNWLTENNLENDYECIINRSFNKDGRSRNVINGRPCTLQQIRELGALLVQIHGQHQHQALLKNDYQRELLDRYAGNTELLEQIQKIFQQWQQLNNQLNQLINTSQDHHAKTEFLQFQLDELEKLNLQEGEFTKLELEYKQLANAERLRNTCQQILDLLNERDEISVIKNLQLTLNQLTTISKIDAKLATVTDLINNAIIQVEEASSEIEHYLNNLELTPERLQEINQRLTILHDLARKHRIKPAELHALQERLRKQLDELINITAHEKKLHEQITQLESQYHQLSSALSKNRNAAAVKLSKQITQKIQPLGMPQGQLQISLQTVEGVHPYGNERVEFLVSANPGQALQALNKIASGGELSRIALAIQVIAAQTTSTPTLIFDEVDVGIGGGTAEIVGSLLKKLGESIQVLCVTHLAQVAAQGDHHLHVQKHIKDKKTETEIRMLTVNEKIQEIARMLGGIKITERTLAHAREMLKLDAGIE